MPGLNNTFEMKVSGLKELEKFMRDTFPAAVNRRILLSAIRASAKPMVATAKAIVKKQSGFLESSIGLKTLTNRGYNKTFASVALAPLSGDLAGWAKYMAYHNRTTIKAFDERTGKIDAGAIGRVRHAHLVEFGFKHTSGKQVPAQPFLRPAFDMESQNFVNSIAAHLKVRIDNALRKQQRVAGQQKLFDAFKKAYRSGS